MNNTCSSKILEGGIPEFNDNLGIEHKYSYDSDNKFYIDDIYSGDIVSLQESCIVVKPLGDVDRTQLFYKYSL